MAEPTAYPGSPSVAAEVREKVLQTFKHTLDMARAGKVEEALLGCDFILKMDARFAPARRLLDALRGVATGTVIDLADFAEYSAGPPKPAPRAAPVSAAAPAAAPPPGPARPAPAPAPPPAPSVSPNATVAFPSFAPDDAFHGENPFAAPSSAPPAPAPRGPAPPPPAATKGFDDLGFDAFADSNPFLAPAVAPAAPSETAPAFPAFEAPSPAPAAFPTFDAPPPAAPAFPTFDAPPPAAPAFPAFDAPPAADLFGASSQDLFGAPAAAAPLFESPGPAFGAHHASLDRPAGPSSLSDLGFGAPSPFAAGPEAVPPQVVASPPPATASPVDPRVTQFLKQGDDAFARGQLQEAIDLWSRVFLIDLNNEEASRRIDVAREKQQSEAQKLELLLSDGVTLYESGDLSGARAKFLEVLAVSESDATARNYLNQIETALATTAAGGAGAALAPPSPAAGSDYLSDELESPVAPSFATGVPGLDTGARGLAGEELPEPSARGQAPVAAKAGPRIDARLLLVAGAAVLAAVAGGAFLFFREKPAPPPSDAPPPRTASTAAAAAEDPIARARALFSQGKAEEALRILAAVPASDPNHEAALVLIDQFKSTSEPAAATPQPVTAAALDEMRASGLAALKQGRSIDAVKALDPVARARPDDTEVATALTQAREQVAELGNAIKRYNEQDYESAQRILWEVKKKSPKNQDVDEYLFKSYFNEGVMNLQAGTMKKAAQSFQEAASLRPQDLEAKRHLKFAQRYSGGADDLLSRIYVKYVSPRP